jgi:hypothetical protein
MSYNKKFGIVNQDVLQDPELSIQAKGLYSLLCTYADKNRRCYPSISTLADHCNKSVRTINYLIEELKKKEYVVRKGRVLILR